jgi:SAM-dependent methyltransferase
MEGEPVTEPAECRVCPLCERAEGLSLLHADATREYWLCPACDLVHVPSRWHPSPDREKERYDQHRNDPADPGYRNFLMQLADALRPRLAPGSRGLDFGSGPTGALAGLFEEIGFPMTRYDPFYAPHAPALQDVYDFIASAEVFEHLFRPADEWRRLVRILRPGGWLGVMTGLRNPQTPFGGWWYRNDFTHVCFFSRRTFQWLADRDGLTLEFVGANVVLLQKP